MHLFIYSFIYSFIHYVSIDCYSPHHCVGLLFFAWHPPLLPHPAAPLPTSHSPLITSHSSHHNSSQHPFSHLSHHSTTYHTTCHSHIITQHSSQHYLSHHLSQQSHRGWLSEGAAACFVWQAQYIGPAGGAASRVVAACPAAGVRVAGAIHRAFWRRCCARGRRLARGWLSCGRRTTHSLLEELLRAAGFRVARAAARVVAAWPAYTGPSGGAAARVVAGWPAAGFRVAGAVPRACWRSCCAHGRGWLSYGMRSTQSLLEELVRAWPLLARGWLSCGRRSTQSLPEELLSHHFVTPLCHTHTIFHTSSFTPCCHTHHLSHAIIDTPSFTHHVVRL